jgi:hypothetical protein
MFQIFTYEDFLFWCFPCAKLENRLLVRLWILSRRNSCFFPLLICSRGNFYGCPKVNVTFMVNKTKLSKSDAEQPGTLPKPKLFEKFAENEREMKQA